MNSQWSNYVFYLMPFRFWQLATGALLFQVLDTYQEWVSSKVTHPNAFAWVALVLFGIGYAFDSGSSNAIVQFAWAIATVFATSCFILAGALAKPGGLPLFNAICTLEPVKYVGKISYQLYLFHWPAILYSKRLAETIEPTGAFTEVAVFGFGLFFGVSLPLFSYHIMEHPLRYWQHKGALRSLAVISAMLALIVGSCIWVGQLRGPLGQEMIQASMPAIQAPGPTETGSSPGFSLTGLNPKPLVPVRYSGVPPEAATKPSLSNQPSDGTQPQHTKSPSRSAPDPPFANQFAFRDTCPEREVEEWYAQLWDSHWDADVWEAKTIAKRFIAEGVGNLSTPTELGRAHATDSPCACRTCGISTAIAPKEVVPDNDSTHGTCMHYTATIDGICLRGCCDEATDMLDAAKQGTATDKIEGCLTPDRDSPDLPKKTMFVIGDSHSANFASTLLLAVRGRYQIRNFHIFATGVVPGSAMTQEFCNEHSCNAADVRWIQQKVFDTIASVAQEGDVVVHQAYSTDMLLILEADETPYEHLQTKALQAYHAQLKEAMQPTLAKGAKLLVIGDWCVSNSAGTSNDPLIVDRFFESEANNFGSKASGLVKASGLAGSIFHVSLYALLLENGECTGRIPGTPWYAYSDAPENQHITGDAATYMWPFLCDALDEIGLM